MKPPYHLNRKSQVDSIRNYVSYRASDVNRFRIYVNGLIGVFPAAADSTTGEDVHHDHWNPPSYHQKDYDVSQCSSQRVSCGEEE